MPADVVSQRFPVLARHEGVWRGVFRRYDVAGVLMAEFPSTIVKRYLARDCGRGIYHQTNRYVMPDGRQEIHESYGQVCDDRIVFTNPRVHGWTRDDPGDAYGRSYIVCLEYLDQPDAYAYETVQISDDGRFRARVTQFVRHGRAYQRTHIDEELVTADWAAWDAANPPD